VLFGLKTLDVVAVNCPNCGHRLRRVDAIKVCGLFFVWCPNSRCRWCMLFDSALALLGGYLYYRINGKVVRILVELKQIGSVVLVKKRDAKASDAVGIKIYPPRDDGSPDFSKESSIVWMDALKALLAGDVRFVPAYLNPVFVKSGESK